jgi:hypothetical protein
LVVVDFLSGMVLIASFPRIGDVVATRENPSGGRGVYKTHIIRFAIAFSLRLNIRYHLPARARSANNGHTKPII